MVKPHELTDARTDAPDTSSQRHAPLGSTLRALLDTPAVRDAFRMLFQQELLGCHVGWPRLLQASTPITVHGAARGALVERWLRRGDVLVELAQAPARESFAAGLLLHAESASRLVDDLLGAPASSSMPSAASQPTDAECGVLAYAAARLCANRASSWLVRDVRPVRERETGWPTPLVLWPLALDASAGSIAAALVMSESLARTIREQAILRTFVSDEPDDRALDQLELGDALVSDRWQLTRTTAGLAGRVQLAVDGTDTCLDAQLGSGQLEVTGLASRPAPHHLELVLATESVSLWQLATLASGTPFTLHHTPSTPASLERAGAVLARGRLVHHRGAVGIRIDERSDAA